MDFEVVVLVAVMSVLISYWKWGLYGVVYFKCELYLAYTWYRSDYIFSNEIVIDCVDIIMWGRQMSSTF